MHAFSDARRLSEIAGLGQLPTVHQMQEGVPSFQYLRNRQDLRASVDQQIQESNLWEHPETISGNISQTSLVSGRVAKTETGIRKQVILERVEGRLTTQISTN